MTTWMRCSTIVHAGVCSPLLAQRRAIAGRPFRSCVDYENVEPIDDYAGPKEVSHCDEA